MQCEGRGRGSRDVEGHRSVGTGGGVVTWCSVFIVPRRDCGRALSPRPPARRLGIALRLRGPLARHPRPRAPPASAAGGLSAVHVPPPPPRNGTQSVCCVPPDEAHVPSDHRSVVLLGPLCTLVPPGGTGACVSADVPGLTGGVMWGTFRKGTLLFRSGAMGVCSAPATVHRRDTPPSKRGALGGLRGVRRRLPHVTRTQRQRALRVPTALLQHTYIRGGAGLIHMLRAAAACLMAPKGDGLGHWARHKSQVTQGPR